MRRADRAAGAGLLLLGAGFAGVAWQRHPYAGPSGPGSGFLPFWLGVTLAVLAALLLARALRARDPGPPWLPAGRGLRRLLVVVAGAAAFIALLPVAGMTLGTALFLLLILRGVERYGWAFSAAIGAGVAGLDWLVFTYWLRVPFPVGVLGF